LQQYWVSDLIEDFVPGEDGKEFNNEGKRGSPRWEVQNQYGKQKAVRGQNAVSYPFWLQWIWQRSSFRDIMAY
jgi:hypothetical protein